MDVRDGDVPNLGVSRINGCYLRASVEGLRHPPKVDTVFGKVGETFLLVPLKLDTHSRHPGVTTIVTTAVKSFSLETGPVSALFEPSGNAFCQSMKVASVRSI